MSHRQPTSTSVEADSVLGFAPLQPIMGRDGITMTDQHGSTVFFNAPPPPPPTARYDVKTSDVVEVRRLGAGQEPQQGLLPQQSGLLPQPGGGCDLAGSFSAHCSHTTIFNHSLPRGPDPGAYNSDDAYQYAHTCNLCGLERPPSAAAVDATAQAHQQMQHMMGASLRVAGPLLAPAQHRPRLSMFLYQNNGCDREHALNQDASLLGFPLRRTQASNAYQHNPQWQHVGGVKTANYIPTRVKVVV